MSALASLVRAYDRLAATRRGAGLRLFAGKDRLSYSAQSPTARRSAPPIDLRDGEGKKKTPRLMAVPQPSSEPRASRPTFCGTRRPMCSASPLARASARRESMRRSSSGIEEWLAGTDDEGLRPFLRFLETWSRRINLSGSAGRRT